MAELRLVVTDEGGLGGRAGLRFSEMKKSSHAFQLHFFLSL